MHLVINAGSSSLKWALYETLESEEVFLSGNFERFGPAAIVRVGSRKEESKLKSHREAVEFLIDLLANNHIAEAGQIKSVTHRVVHGGKLYTKPVVVDEHVLQNIRDLARLAPLHNPANAAGIQACIEHFPQAKQIAVFDTGFHHTLPPEAYMYAIPMELYERYHIRKYGFHGISHSYISDTLYRVFGEDIDAISCHLGNGSSITALKEGKSLDTTMGFTPLDGVIMGTRSGMLDPEIPLFLIKTGKYSVDEVERMLEKRSGLKGITGFSDLREIYKRAHSGNRCCELAIDMLTYKIAMCINQMRTAVASPKAIVFTGGIGEKAWFVRRRVCELLHLRVNDQANAQSEMLISHESSPIKVLVIPTNEQLQMHRMSRQLVDQSDYY